MDTYLASSEVLETSALCQYIIWDFFCFNLKYSMRVEFTLFQNENKHPPG